MGCSGINADYMGELTAPMEQMVLMEMELTALMEQMVLMEMELTALMVSVLVEDPEEDSVSPLGLITTQTDQAPILKIVKPPRMEQTTAHLTPQMDQHQILLAIQQQMIQVTQHQTPPRPQIQQQALTPMTVNHLLVCPLISHKMTIPS